MVFSLGSESTSKSVETQLGAMNLDVKNVMGLEISVYYIHI